MKEEPKDIKTIFSESLEKKDAGERAAYLDKVCGNDVGLRAEVEALLKAHEEAGDFLKVPAFGADVTLEGLRIEGPGTMIGRYKLLELIGEGGMGLVYLSEQQEPIRRRVALKIVKLGMDTKQVIARFEAEKQMLALLDHPNIARVYDAGTTETGRPYFVMELVKGIPITEYCDQHKSSIEERLKLFRQVCEGVQHAHQKGIIHRDIKPSNILVTVEGDRAVPKIIDFGIAKAVTQPLTERTLFTQQGQLLGTPEYMSPEQVDMATQDIDTRCDIYSLGVVLYQLLAGVLPFERECFERAGFAEIQQTIREQEPASPSVRLTSLGEKAKTIAASRSTQAITLARRLHRELEWIPLKAMRKDRCRRYRSASELADDVRNYLNGLPLIAGPETAVYLVKKFVRRHAGSVATVALVAAAIILGLIVSTAMYFRSERALQREAVARTQAEQAKVLAEQAKNAEQEQRKIAETKAEDLRRSLYINSINLADSKYKEGNIARVRELLDSSPNDLRGWEWYRLNHISDQSIMTLRGHREIVWSVAVSPDGKRIVSGAWDATIKVWDAATGVELMTLRGHEHLVNSVAFSPDGERIVSGSEDNTIKVWDAASGIELMTIAASHKERVGCVAFSPDGERIVSGSEYEPVVRVWDTATGAEVMALHGHEEGVASVAFSPDGRRIVVGGYDAVKVWDATTGAEIMTVGGHGSTSFSPDGKYIISGGVDDTIKVWDATTGAEIMTLSGHNRRVLSIAFSPDGKHIVSGSLDNTIKVWDTVTGAEVMTLRGHVYPSGSVVFSPDGKRIISGGWDETVKVWDITIDREVMTLRGQGGQVYSIAFSPDGKRIVSGSADKTIKVWDATTGDELMTLRGHNGWISSVAYSPDGSRIVSCSGDKMVKVWDAATGASLMTLRGHSEPVSSVAFGPDGKRIISSSLDKTVKVWDAVTGNEIMTINGHNDWVSSVSFSPDGKYILSGSGDKTVKVWDAATGAEMMSLCGDEFRGVTCVSFSPDGTRIASAGEEVKVFDAATGVELMTLRGHQHIVDSVTFSPDSKRIVSSSRDGTARVWDAATGAELMTLQDAIGSAKFSPDGKTIAAGSFGGSIKLWESGVPEDGYGPRQAAEAARKMVDELYKEHGFYYEVINKLHTDKTLAEPIRELAQQIANSRRGEDTEKLNREIWKLDSLPEPNVEGYKSTLEKAEKAAGLEPDDWSLLTTLGVAKYRVGAYENAPATLKRSEEIRTKAHLDTDPVNIAFIAMALHQLGQTEAAQVGLDRLRGLFEDGRFDDDQKVQGFLFEAEKLFAGKNSKVYSVWESIEDRKLEEAVELVEELRSLNDNEIARCIEGAIEWLARAFYDRGESRGRRHPPEEVKGPEYAETIADYEAAVHMDPNHALALKALSWLQATCPLAEFRDGPRAVEAATKACELTNWGNYEYIATLAAAYSEVGDFDNAIKWQKEAINLLPEDKRTEWQDNYQARLKVYESHKPYHKGSLWSFTNGELVAWWKMDEVKDGNVIDSSGNNLHGKLIGDAKIISDPERGNVLSLDGDGDYVDCGNDLAFGITGSITITAWVKVKAFDKDWQAIVTKGDSTWRLARNWGDNYVKFNCSGVETPTFIPWSLTGVAGSVNVNDRKWHHVTGVYDGTKIYLYVDGILDASVSAWSTIDTNNYPVYIGENAATLRRGWNGLIDDVRIYSYALSEAEIKDLYTAKEPARAKD